MQIDRLTSIILYIISGLCFAVLLASWVGYVKFMNLTPSFVIVQITEKTDNYYGEVIIRSHDTCQLENATSWPRNSILTDGQRLIFKLDKNTTLIPISINYNCEFMIFKKNGNQMVYAIIE